MGKLTVLFLTLGVRPGSIGLGFIQSLGTDDHRLSKMAQQVKDVLPHVPLNIIIKELGMILFQFTFTFFDSVAATLLCPFLNLSCTCTCLVNTYSKNQLR